MSVQVEHRKPARNQAVRDKLRSSVQTKASAYKTPIFRTRNLDRDKYACSDDQQVLQARVKGSRAVELNNQPHAQLPKCGSHSPTGLDNRQFRDRPEEYNETYQACGQPVEGPPAGVLP